MKNDVEQLINDLNLNAPRVTKELIESKISSIEYVTHKTNTNKLLRWCIINMNNGFSVTGEPSACVSIENDNEEVGKKIAFENTFDKIWSFEGYLLSSNKLK